MAVVEVLSPVDGSVALYHNDVGASVVKGEALVEVEAMKVFFRVEAPEDGTLVWVAELGEFVGHGEVVAKLETSG